MLHDNRDENEAVFRAANERLWERLKGLAGGQALPFICECSDAHCLATVELVLPAFERIRAEGGRQFFVLPGHESASDRIVRREDDHLLVEKPASP